MTNYIKVHNLQNPENKKQIIPDKSLKELLGAILPEDEQKGYTYFNLQKYMKHHFPKSKSSSSKIVSKSA